MIINFLPRGRSEGSSSIVDKVPGLKWLLSLVKTFFGTFDWCLAEAIGECSPILADTNLEEPVNTTDVVPICSHLHKRFLFVQQVPLQYTALIFNKGLQSRKSGQRFDWSAVRAITESLIEFCPRLNQWRDNMGWRGPPWALFTAMHVVRLQE